MYSPYHAQQSAGSSPAPSVSGAQPSISSLLPYTSNLPLTSPVASTTSLPSYNKLSASPPCYTSPNPNIAQHPGTISAPSQYQFQQPQPFAPQAYTLPQQYPQPVFYAPSPLRQEVGARYSYPTYQPQVQAQILNPAMGHATFQPQQQQFLTQLYSPFPQIQAVPMSYIQLGGQQPGQSSMLYRVVESDEEEKEKEPRQSFRMPVMGVGYRIGGGK